MGEFGATITFVSNIPGETQTLPLAIYTFTQVPGGDAGAMRLDPGLDRDLDGRRCSAPSCCRGACGASDGGMSLEVDIAHRAATSASPRASRPPRRRRRCSAGRARARRPDRHRRRAAAAGPRPHRRRRRRCSSTPSAASSCRATAPHRLRLPGQPAVPASERAPQPALRALVQPRSRRHGADLERSSICWASATCSNDALPRCRAARTQRVAIGRALLAASAAPADGRAAGRARRGAARRDPALHRAPARRDGRAHPLCQPLRRRGGAGLPRPW